MRVGHMVVVAALATAACKDKPAQPKPSPHPAGDGGTAIDWASCDDALRRAATAPLIARAKLVIDGCKVCGDWTAILRWNTPSTEGGPSRAEIEAAMAECNAYCSGDARLKFLGTLDKARGSSARTPWRQLGDICKDKVSALPDQRFMSAPYFALDRIARAAAARGGDTATLASAFDLPLPALTIVGTGVVLPTLPTGVSPQTGELQITVLGEAMYVGRMPRARLGANGVTVELGTAGYPGTEVKLADLRETLTQGVADGKAQTITVLAPQAMAARALVPIISMAATVAPIHLAARAHESPEDWDLPGTIPVALVGGDDVVVSAAMTVQQLADELAKRAAHTVNRIGVTAQ